ncbi:MAG: hypothetical protein ACTSQ0_02035 [Candidatus Heimdallarchaeota archaeon]
MSKSKSKTSIQFATFMERLKPTFMDYIGPWFLFFVGAFVQTPLAGIGTAGVILGAFCELLGIIAILFINGYAPALNRGYTPNKMTHGVRLMKIVNKSTMELREIDEGDMGILLLRAIIGWFEAFLFLPLLPGLLALLIINTSETNQRIADLVAGTVVIKVEPVEKVNIKDFRYKKSDPPPTFDGVAAVKATGKPAKGPTIDKKIEGKTVDGVFTNPTLIVVGKWIFISSAIYLILAQIIHFVSFTLRRINTSFYIFGESYPIGNTAWQLDNVLTIIGYVVLFISCAGFVLYYMGIRNSETKKPLLLITGFYLLFIIFRIVYLEAMWSNGSIIAFINIVSGYIVIFGIGYGGFVFEILSTICLIVSLFLLNKFIRAFNEENQTNVKRFGGHIVLIVFFTLLLATYITGMVAEPMNVFAVVIFYCITLFKLILIFVYLGIFAGLIKLRKIAIIE